MQLLDLLSHFTVRATFGEALWATRLTLTAYYAFAVVALFPLRHRPAPTMARFYGGLALFLLSLGLTRQFRLLDQLTTLGRGIAMVEGWYWMRWSIQQQLIQGGIAGGVVLLLLLAWLQRRQLHRHGLILLGASYLVTFLLVRTISLHHLDAWLNQRWLGLRYATALEWGGLLLIGVGLGIARWTRSVSN